MKPKLPPLLLVGNRGSIHIFRWSRYLDDSRLDYDIYSRQSAASFGQKCQRDLTSFSSLKDGRIRRFLNPILALRGMMHASRYQVVNVHSLDFYNAIISFGVRGSLLLTCYGSDILVFYEQSRGLVKLLLRSALRRAKAITCDSSSVRDLLVREGIDPGHIDLVTWGVDAEEFCPTGKEERLALRSRFGLPSAALVCLSIRTLKPLYRILELVQRFKAEIKSDHIVLFVHVNPFGDSSYVDECIKAAAGATNIVFKTKPIDAAEVRSLYRVSDVSLHFPESDATPVSMLEGIACCNAILCDSSIPAYRELGEAYSLTFTDLSALDEAVLRRATAMGLASSAENRRVLMERDSRSRSAALVSDLVNRLLEGSR
ncbi:MAG: glycosyltransferase [Spirochaetota bacterium]